MSPEKLEALRALAADMRTPDNEARNAALIYVREGGAQASRNAADAPTIEKLKAQLAELEQDRDVWKRRAMQAGSLLNRAIDLGSDARRMRDDAYREVGQPSPEPSSPFDPFDTRHVRSWYTNRPF